MCARQQTKFGAVPCHQSVRADVCSGENVGDGSSARRAGRAHGSAPSSIAARKSNLCLGCTIKPLPHEHTADGCARPAIVPVTHMFDVLRSSIQLCYHPTLESALVIDNQWRCCGMKHLCGLTRTVGKVWLWLQLWHCVYMLSRSWCCGLPVMWHLCRRSPRLHLCCVLLTLCIHVQLTVVVLDSSCG